MPQQSELKIADLYCGAGGAAMGIHQACEDAGVPHRIVGFDTDRKPLRHYPFEAVQQDALTVDLSPFDAVWASPPCQAYSRTRSLYASEGLPDLIPATRELLRKSGKPYIIENVQGAPLLHWVLLCGTMFGMKTLRHRLFEPWQMGTLLGLPHPKHRVKTVSHGWLPCDPNRFYTITSGMNCTVGHARKIMGIYWMTRYELTQAIPPVYSRYIWGYVIQEWRNRNASPV